MRTVNRIGKYRVMSMMKWFVSGMCHLVLFSFILFFILLFLFSLLGYQKFVVVSGSMVPVIPVGSCILVKEKEVREIEAGEILTFYINDGKTAVTHRVLRNDAENQSFFTGGDANPSPDAAPVPYKNCIGTVRLVLPFFGYLLIFLNSVYGKASAVCLLFFCMGMTAVVKGAERRTIEP